ncbi:MAG TPA: hypothetical protein VE863_11925 [Pyrinomonadaceae bacterium]|jgi:hypothetical protein|nr:hypothetical protein [Pyrinomonadaceae bacterium]
MIGTNHLNACNIGKGLGLILVTLSMTSGQTPLVRDCNKSIARSSQPNPECREWYIVWRKPNGTEWGRDTGATKQAVEKARDDTIAFMKRYAKFADEPFDVNYQNPSEPICDACLHDQCDSTSANEQAARELAERALDQVVTPVYDKIKEHLTADANEARGAAIEEALSSRGIYTNVTHNYLEDVSKAQQKVKELYQKLNDVHCAGADVLRVLNEQSRELDAVNADLNRTYELLPIRLKRALGVETFPEVTSLEQRKLNRDLLDSVIAGNTRRAEQLLSQGAEINALGEADLRGKKVSISPLMAAAALGNLGLIDLLLRKGADVDQNGSFIPDSLATNGTSRDTVTLTVTGESSRPGQSFQNKVTWPLGSGADSNQTSSAPDVPAVDVSPLGLAIDAGSSEAVKKLLNSGASTNIGFSQWKNLISHAETTSTPEIKDLLNQTDRAWKLFHSALVQVDNNKPEEARKIVSQLMYRSDLGGWPYELLAEIELAEHNLSGFGHYLRLAVSTDSQIDIDTIIEPVLNMLKYEPISDDRNLIKQLELVYGRRAVILAVEDFFVKDAIKKIDAAGVSAETRLNRLLALKPKFAESLILDTAIEETKRAVEKDKEKARNEQEDSETRAALAIVDPTERKSRLQDLQSIYPDDPRIAPAITQAKAEITQAEQIARQEEEKRKAAEERSRIEDLKRDLSGLWKLDDGSTIRITQTGDSVRAVYVEPSAERKDSRGVEPGDEMLNGTYNGSRLAGTWNVRFDSDHIPDKCPEAFHTDFAAHFRLWISNKGDTLDGKLDWLSLDPDDCSPKIVSSLTPSLRRVHE